MRISSVRARVDSVCATPPLRKQVDRGPSTDDWRYCAMPATNFLYKSSIPGNERRTFSMHRRASARKHASICRSVSLSSLTCQNNSTSVSASPTPNEKIASTIGEVRVSSPQRYASPTHSMTRSRPFLSSRFVDSASENTSWGIVRCWQVGRERRNAIAAIDPTCDIAGVAVSQRTQRDQNDRGFGGGHSQRKFTS
jgi:hypothetical protein